MNLSNSGKLRRNPLIEVWLNFASTAIAKLAFDEKEAKEFVPELEDLIRNATILLMEIKK